ncbi:MAG: DoxX family protein [Acidobacteriota bacterium]
MTPWISAVDRRFLALRRLPFFYRLTLFTRITLAAGFIPTGGVKLLGLRFSQISIESPIGAFFEAMFLTGGYWRFIGASQVLAGLLLLIPATAHLGAGLFLPIILNIFVITVALSFKGTWVVTGLMLLAVLYLCAWDYHRFRGLLTLAPLSAEPAMQRLDRIERVGFSVFGTCFLYCFLATRGAVPMDYVLPVAAAGLLGGLLALGQFLATTWRRRFGGAARPAPQS